MKNRASASTSKKVVVVLLTRKAVRGYLSPAQLGRSETLSLLTMDGEQETIKLADVKCVYFVREFKEPFEPERKTFLSRPKLDGLWVRVKYRDEETLEGVVANDLVALLDRGVNLVPPDPGTNCTRIFIPRTAIAEMKVLGVVGIARRTPARAAAAQPTLFNE